MTNLTDIRPTANTWTVDKKKTIRYAPDCQVYINGDTTIPGCHKCGGRIDVQEFIINVSVELGVDPSSTSCSLSLSVPTHHIHNFVSGGECKLIPGLELHIYMKGYFPVTNMFDGPQEAYGDGEDLTGFPHVPMYHTFHGVIISSDVSYSGGFQNISLSGAGMMHFWQYQQISISASQFGAKPQGSKLKTTLIGHNFNGKTPYAIIYNLFHDVAGAAAGVGFALKAEGNQTAKSSVTGDSLFSMNLQYWKERFSTRMINLRMHGASGEVFNAAQSSFLARISTSGLELLSKEAILLGKQQNNNAKKSNLFSQAIQLGIISETRDVVTGEIRYSTGLNFTDTQAVSNSGVTEQFNLGAIQAYVQSISQYGEVNLFESTYETKMDMVQQVCDKTGFEFYQDADGDFVFKPPMYNLDTSSSRIYRLEDEDIIDISFSMKEPEATYVTIKGSHFKNLKDTGTEGEFGTRGQYIDYKLVAQYGWREGSMETDFFTNPRAMFYACVNRLDILNIQTYSGSATIPLRPELRQGYPVYIPYLDSFYYVTNISHSFSFGGGCTSSLELSARRKKFYPPTIPGKLGVDAVALDNTYYPKRALEVIDGGGNPRLAGFPNVVLALDTEVINPLFFSVGSDLTDVTNPVVVRNLIELAKQYGILIADTSDPNYNPTEGPFLLAMSDTENAELDPNGTAVKSSDIPNETSTTSSSKEPRKVYFTNLLSSAQQYSKLQSTSLIEYNVENVKQMKLAAIQDIRETEIPNIDSFIQLETNLLAELGSDASDEIKKVTNEKIAALNADKKSFQERITRLEKDIEELTEEKVKELNSEGAADEGAASLIRNLIDQVSDYFKKSIGGGDGPSVSKTAAYLDLLSDKKASFVSNQVPGHFRYFSASHPNPKFQGMSTIKASSQEGPSASSDMEKLVIKKRVSGFLRYPITSDPSGRLPEAEYGDVEVVNGLRVLTGSKQDTVLSTDQIQTLSFCKHTVKNSSGETFYRYGQVFTGVNTKYETLALNSFITGYGNKGLFDTIRVIHKSTWDSFFTFSVTSITVGGITRDIVIPSTVSIFPDTILIGNQTISVDIGVLQAQQLVFGTSNSVNATKTTSEFISRALTTELMNRVNKYLNDEWVTLNDKYPTTVETSSPERVNEEQFFSQLVKELSKGTMNFISGSNVKLETEKPQTFYTPVFPVSDEKGYEVYGMYRYGRGLSIVGDVSLDRVNFADPFQFASPEAVENFTKKMKGETSSDVATTSGQATDIPVPQKPITEAERLLIESIQKNPETPVDVLQYIANATQTGVGLSNWIQNSKEYTRKIIAPNIPINLAQIRPITNLNICDCRIQEASVALDMLATEGFVEILPRDVDQITQQVANDMQIRGEQWEENKKILSGEIILPNS